MANNNNRNHNNNEYGNNFGMNHHGNNIADLYFHMNNNDNNDNEIKMDGIDMNDFKEFDGDIWWQNMFLGYITFAWYFIL